jgi:hypothetical protein
MNDKCKSRTALAGLPAPTLLAPRWRRGTRWCASCGDFHMPDAHPPVRDVLGLRGAPADVWCSMCPAPSTTTVGNDARCDDHVGGAP